MREEQNIEWYNEAAERLIHYYDNGGEWFIEKIFSNLKMNQKEDKSFHHSQHGGLQVRDVLKKLGYENKYGNIEKHYLQILKIVYKKLKL